MLGRFLLATTIGILALSGVADAAAVGSVATIAALRMYPGAATTINVDAYSTPGDGGGGTVILNGAGCGSGDDGVIVRHCYSLNFTG